MDTYEKKYKDLEAKIKKAHLFAQTDSTKSVLEDILPELSESEDERVRKIITDSVFYQYGADAEYKDVLNYLDRPEQQDKKEAKFVFPKFLYARTTNNKTIDVSYAPQSLDAVEYIRSDSLQQEWSEEDEKILNELLDHCNIENAKWYNWLKSIRPAQDCSADCPKHLEGYISGRADAENKLLEMYGILLMPDGELRMKPRWKPSEEQMKALQNAVALTACDKELARLYNQLKKM